MRKILIATLGVLGVLINFPVWSSSGDRGKWKNVTPANVDLRNPLNCGNFGSITMVSDPARPSDLYTQFNCQGVWKSSDYGLTWTGPVNVGQGGAGAAGAGGLAIARGPDGQSPILYSAGIRGSGLGFWKSTDGGVSWTRYRVAPGRDRQDFYPPVVNPNDSDHLIMTGHHMNLIVQSRDGGHTWTEIPMASGMMQSGGTGLIFFINTGNVSTTSQTLLWTAEMTGGKVGTWRTADSGTTWVLVDTNEHPHGQMQIYQPDTSGVVFMSGVYSALGWGVLRSADFGQTWRRVGIHSEQANVFGTPSRIYSMFAWACADCKVAPRLQSAPTPGNTGWESMTTPSDMSIGAAQAAVVFDGKSYIIVTANWKAGLWRYVE